MSSSKDSWADEAWDEEVTVEPPRKRRQVRRAGSIHDRTMKAQLPLGPETVEELYLWPEFIIQQLAKKDGCGPRLLSLLDHGLRLTTEYSGMDCPVEALVQLEKAMHKILGRPMDDPRSRFAFLSACDNDELAQSVLLDLIQRRGGQGCLFCDISDRLPLHFRNKLKKKSRRRTRAWRRRRPPMSTSPRP